jgi:hypothetical protein
MSYKTTKWTTSEDATLVRMSLERASITTVSKKLKRSESAVTNRAKYIRKSITHLLKEKTVHARTKHRQGHRAYLGVSVRSSWEANFLNALNYQKIKWEYEPRTFVFHEIERGTRSYLPDVYLPKEDIWVEVKGQLRSADKTKTRRLKKFYPEIFAKLQYVTKNPRVEASRFYESMDMKCYAYYDDLKKQYGSIKNWEH